MYSSKVRLVFIFAILKAAEATNVMTECPPREDIRNCACDILPNATSLVVTCNETDDSSLKSIIKGLSGRKVTLHLLKGNLTEIVNGTFQNLNAERIDIVDSRIEKFDLFSGFHGMQHTLERFAVSKINIKKLTFSSGKEFRRLHLISLKNCIGFGWAEKIIPYLPEHLTFIEINNCSVRSHEKFSFRQFKNLTFLHLVNNGMRFIKRSFLPEPASHLVQYRLSYNPISCLPHDMFVGMPKLKVIDLDHTSLTTLHYQTFQPILDRHNKFWLDIRKIPLNCDCHIAWLLEKRIGRPYWRKTSPQCKLPASLENVEAKSLKSTNISMCPVTSFCSKTDRIVKGCAK